MSTESIVKWGLLALAGFFFLRWLIGTFEDNSLPDISGGELFNGYWAAPIVGPSPVVGWSPAWRQRGRRRGRGWRR